MTRPAPLARLALAIGVALSAPSCASGPGRPARASRAQGHALSCEARAACDLLEHHGIPVAEDAFLAALPRSDNPDLGFVGDPDDDTGCLPPEGYGVHAPPVAATLRGFGLSADAVSGRDLAWLRAELDAGRPVILWVVSGFEEGAPIALRDARGRAFEAVRGEHAVLALRRRGSRVVVLDPAHGEEREVDEAALLRSWRAFRGAAVRADPPRSGRGVGGVPR